MVGGGLTNLPSILFLWNSGVFCSFSPHGPPGRHDLLIGVGIRGGAWLPSLPWADLPCSLYVVSQDPGIMGSERPVKTMCSTLSLNRGKLRPKEK